MFLVLQKWIHFLLYKPQLDRVFSVYDVIDNLLGCGDSSDNCTTWQRLLLEAPWFRLMLNIFVVGSGEKIVPGKKKGFRGTHLSKLGMLVWSIWGS